MWEGVRIKRKTIWVLTNLKLRILADFMYPGFGKEALRSSLMSYFFFFKTEEHGLNGSLFKTDFFVGESCTKRAYNNLKVCFQWLHAKDSVLSIVSM